MKLYRFDLVFLAILAVGLAGTGCASGSDGGGADDAGPLFRGEDFEKGAVRVENDAVLVLHEDEVGIVVHDQRKELRIHACPVAA